MSRANDTLMDAIHGLVAGSLKDELERAAWRASQPRTVEVEDPENEGAMKTVKNPDYEPLSPQLIDKARAFLKDNGVDAPQRAGRVDRLADTLGALDLDDVGHELHTRQ